MSRQLELIVDIDLLDSAEGLPARPVVHNHAQLDADNEKVRSRVDGPLLPFCLMCMAFASPLPAGDGAPR